MSRISFFSNINYHELAINYHELFFCKQPILERLHNVYAEFLGDECDDLGWQDLGVGAQAQLD